MSAHFLPDDYLTECLQILLLLPPYANSNILESWVILATGDQPVTELFLNKSSEKQNSVHSLQTMTTRAILFTH
jgi:hypothetical protein